MSTENLITNSLDPANIMNVNSPIGVFDSGLGGLTVLKELMQLLPQEKFIYLGDTARYPYGSKGSETIVRYARECAGFLMKENIKLLVVACNTASSFALDILQSEVPCAVIGTIEQAARLALQKDSKKRIGVIGTEATINSSVYEKRLRSLDPSIEVFSKACPLFVPFVEQGMFEGEIVDKVVELYLGDIKQKNVDVLILGCTHYPLMKGAISKFVGIGVEIVECSKAIAFEVQKVLASSNLLASQGSPKTLKYFVTDGVERFNGLADVFLCGDKVSAVKVENLSE